MRRHVLLLSFLFAGGAAAADADRVRYVDPQDGQLRATPVTQAQRDAQKRFEGRSNPYAGAETHVLADGTVRMRLGKALTYGVQVRAEGGRSAVVCDATSHEGHAHAAADQEPH